MRAGPRGLVWSPAGSRGVSRGLLVRADPAECPVGARPANSLPGIGTEGGVSMSAEPQHARVDRRRLVPQRDRCGLRRAYSPKWRSEGGRSRWKCRRRTGNLSGFK